MTAPVHPLELTLISQDGRSLLQSIAAWPELAGSPARLLVDNQPVDAGPAWTDEASRARAQLAGFWPLPGGGEARVTLWLRHPRVSVILPGGLRAAEPTIERLLALDFDLISCHTPWAGAWQSREPRFNGPGGLALGWAFLLRGERGHDHLVSRRWLDHAAPWTLRRAGETSVVQFHDLSADADAAYAQATPLHERFGNSERGGTLFEPHRSAHQISGLYVPERRELRIICAAGREVSQVEMRDACAARRLRRTDSDRPIERIAYVFVDEGDARRHLHELWLRELECWAFARDGTERRLDDAYRS